MTDMTDQNEPEAVPVYLLVKIEDAPITHRRTGRANLGRLRKAMHETGIPMTDIVLSTDRPRTLYGLDQTEDVAAVAEIIDRHLEHAKAAMRARRSQMTFEERLAEAQAVETKRHRLSLEDGPVRQISIIQVWIEGYAATGEGSTATSQMIYGFGVDDAMERWKRDSPDAYRYLTRSPEHRSPLTSDTGWSYWGCRIFLEEADARKSFG